MCADLLQTLDVLRLQHPHPSSPVAGLWWAAGSLQHIANEQWQLHWLLPCPLNQAALCWTWTSSCFCSIPMLCLVSVLRRSAAACCHARNNDAVSFISNFVWDIKSFWTFCAHLRHVMVLITDCSVEYFSTHGGHLCYMWSIKSAHKLNLYQSSRAAEPRTIIFIWGLQRYGMSYWLSCWQILEKQCRAFFKALKRKLQDFFDPRHFSRDPLNDQSGAEAAYLKPNWRFLIQQPLMINVTQGNRWSFSSYTY